MVCRALECPYNRNSVCKKLYVSLNAVGGCSFLYKQGTQGYVLNGNVLTPDYKAMVAEVLEERERANENRRNQSSDTKVSVESKDEPVESGGAANENEPEIFGTGVGSTDPEKGLK
jgi:hypothetical protein